MADPEVYPTDLKFRFQLNKQLPCSITVANPSPQRMAFKVKTTNPKKYTVRPSSGVAEPKSTANVQVLMQAQKEFPPDINNCKDKFMIQTIYLAPGEELTVDSFKREANKDIREVKLRVVMEAPPAPPSPVPEASEGEEDLLQAARARRPEQAGGEDARIAVAAADAASVRAQNRELHERLDALRGERDALRTQVRALQTSKDRGLGTPGKPKAASRPSMLLLILLAVAAFVAGDYLQRRALAS